MPEDKSTTVREGDKPGGGIPAGRPASGVGAPANRTPEEEAADRRRARAGFVTSIAVTALAIGALIWRLGS